MYTFSIENFAYSEGRYRAKTLRNSVHMGFSLFPYIENHIFQSPSGIAKFPIWILLFMVQKPNTITNRMRRTGRWTATPDAHLRNCWSTNAPRCCWYGGQSHSDDSDCQPMAMNARLLTVQWTKLADFSAFREIYYRVFSERKGGLLRRLSKQSTFSYMAFKTDWL